MVGVDDTSLQEDSVQVRPSRLAWSESWQPLGTVPHSLHEQGDFSQWLCRDDDIMNIVLDISIITNNHTMNLRCQL